jgi:MOSC domain-containing protein YiiM
MTIHPTVVSVQVGRIREYTDSKGMSWRSAIAKESLPGPLQLGKLGPVGDEVGDPRHHGGIHKAVLAYPSEHYTAWKVEGVLDGGPGGFGENLTVQGLMEEEVCVGDVFELGGAQLQVSQPRQPCHTLVKRWGVADLVERIWDTARTGWYLRVLREGTIQVGQTLVLVDRPHAGWTVARVLRINRGLGVDPEERRAAGALAHLSPSWQEKLTLGASTF